MVNTRIKAGIGVFRIMCIARGGRWPGCGHEIVLPQGAEKVLAGNHLPIHDKIGGIFTGIVGIKTVKTDLCAVLKRKGQGVAFAAQRGISGGKIQNNAVFRSIGDRGLLSELRTGKMNICHNKTPEVYPDRA